MCLPPPPKLWHCLFLGTTHLFFFLEECASLLEASYVVGSKLGTFFCGRMCLPPRGRLWHCLCLCTSLSLCLCTCTVFVFVPLCLFVFVPPSSLFFLSLLLRPKSATVFVMAWSRSRLLSASSLLPPLLSPPSSPLFGRAPDST